MARSQGLGSFPGRALQRRSAMTPTLSNGAHEHHSTRAAAPVKEASSHLRRLLIVEDNDQARRQLQRLLQQDPQLAVESVPDGHKALQHLVDQSYSIVITDLRLPGLDGMELIKEVHQRNLPVTVIVTTGHGSIDEAVQAIRLGAYDFLTKPIDVDNLRLVVGRALRDRCLQDEVAYLRARLQSTYSFHNTLSKNPHMHAGF